MDIKEILSKYKPIIVLLGIILVLAGLNLYMLWLLNQEEDVDDEVSLAKEVNEEVSESKLVKVDIKGEIKKPGLYEVSDENRVMDIINKAGGLTDNADTSVINLSKKVKDEMVILVYSKKEVEELKEKDEEVVCPEVNDACITDEVEEPLVSSDSEEISSKISINKATIEELQKLSGIGEAKAKAIIEYRLKEGAFEKIEDIKNVSGIGDALFEKIKDDITI